jgi:hypothetical protein
MARSTILVETNPAPNSSEAPPVRKRRRIILRILLLIVIALSSYAAFDLLAPRSSRMRAFDPNEVARLETAMWRSYYDKQQLQLYNQMTELLRSQYNLPFIRSNTGDLAHSLAALSSELYQMPSERFTEHARLRAEAMTIRDKKAEEGGVTEADWARIDELLHGSWQSLFSAVNG